MRKAGRTATQRDVATAAGVSTASVSRVLNSAGPVKPAVRARVQAAIESLGYIPHSAARALALNRSSTLGAIIPTLDEAIFAQGTNAFTSAARELGHTVIVSVSNYDLDDEPALIRTMLERGVDGLMLVGNRHRERVFHLLRDAGIPHVCTGAYEAASINPNIGFSNHDAVGVLVEHLLALGHQRFAMLAGVVDDNDRAAARLAGVTDRLSRANVELNDSCVLQVRYDVAHAREAFRALMQLQPRPTAVICGNDVIALGAVLEAERLGVRIPEDVSVTGFDNLPIAGEMNPSITTIAVPARTMGERAAVALVDAVLQKRNVKSEALSVRLIERETTGPAPVDAI